jgi:REP element-mobilizing transposase RayT
MILNNIGREIEKYYLGISEKYDYVLIDEFIIMPNHIHFVIFVNNVENKDALI